MDPLQKRWHNLHIRSLEKREYTHSERLRRRKLDVANKQKKAAARMHMKVPTNMSILENREETLEFISLIKKRIFEEDLYVLLDFSACEFITPETCIILAAEIDRCKRKIPDSVQGTYPNNAAVYASLNEVGFFALLGIKALRPFFDDMPEISAVRLQSGKDDPENLVRGMKEIFYRNDGNPETEYSGEVYRALTEAMGNATEHAYPKSFVESNFKTCIPQWWRAGFKFDVSKNVYMILYDQGAGIPYTVKTNWSERLNEAIAFLKREPFDGEKIAMAMERGRSRTKLQGRGQGSYDMQKLIRKSSDGVLSVLSYKGAYTYPSTGEWTSESFTTPLEGTLVMWKICLNTLPNDGNEDKDDQNS